MIFIHQLQKLQIVIDKNLTDCINEFTVYKWQEDKDGNTLPKPIDKNNHIIDAIRYALSIEMQMSKEASTKPMFALSGGNPINNYKGATTYQRYNPLARR